MAQEPVSCSLNDSRLAELAERLSLLAAFCEKQQALVQVVKLPAAMYPSRSGTDEPQEIE
jgi:hypothetical protein